MCLNDWQDKLRFLDSHVERLPALLYSFPGSGNTWVRLLIEYATGVFSGSVYDDLSLKSVLPGEGMCDRRVAVVKVYIATHFVCSFSLLTVL